MIKKLPWLGLVLTAVLSVPASAGYKLTLPKAFTSHVVGGYDFTNKAPLTGYSVDTLWLRRYDKERPLFYLSVHHVYRIESKALGALGGSLGMNTGQAAKTISEIITKRAPSEVSSNKWLSVIGNYTSIEVSGGYYLFGPEPEKSRSYFAIMGKIRVPLEKLWEKKEETK